MGRLAFLSGAVLGLASAACSDSGSVASTSDAAAGRGGSGAGAAGAPTGGSAGDGGAPGAAGAAGGSGGSAGDGVLVGATDAPDCTPPTPDGTCDTFPQCGCGIGKRCEIIDTATGKTVCVDDGVVLPFQSCSSFFDQDCVAGSYCDLGSCRPFCEASTDCLGQFQECQDLTRFVAGSSVPIPGARVCSAGCDPISSGEVCGPGLGCSFINGVTQCVTAGTGVGVGKCQSDGLACAPGTVCLENGATGSRDCAKWCRIGNANDCTAPEACAPLTTMPTFDGQQYGACLAP